MLNASEKWKLVDEKLAELQGLVEGNWDNGEWQLALMGEKIIKSVEQSQANATEMRHQTNILMARIKNLQNQG